MIIMLLETPRLPLYGHGVCIGRRTWADKLKLSVEFGTLLVLKSVVFNATDKVHSVQVLTILYLKDR